MHGVDLSAESIAQARRRARRFGVRAIFTVADLRNEDAVRDLAETLQGPFDLIVFFFSVQYLASSREHLSAVLRMARALSSPATRLLLTLPSATAIEELAERGSGELVSATFHDFPGSFASYDFDLSGGIERCPEFLLSRGDLVELMAEAGWDADIMGFSQADLLPELRRTMRAPLVRSLTAPELEVVALYDLCVGMPLPTDERRHHHEDDTGC